MTRAPWTSAWRGPSSTARGWTSGARQGLTLVPLSAEMPASPGTPVLCTLSLKPRPTHPTKEVAYVELKSGNTGVRLWREVYNYDDQEFFEARGGITTLDSSPPLSQFSCLRLHRVPVVNLALVPLEIYIPLIVSLQGALKVRRVGACKKRPCLEVRARHTLQNTSAPAMDFFADLDTLVGPAVQVEPGADRA